MLHTSSKRSRLLRVHIFCKVYEKSKSVATASSLFKVRIRQHGANSKSNTPISEPGRRRISNCTRYPIPSSGRVHKSGVQPYSLPRNHQNNASTKDLINVKSPHQYAS